MLNKCPVCQKSLLNHAKRVQCVSCKTTSHLKCIYLNKNVQTDLLNSSSGWLGEPCIVSIFPFNHIENDREYRAAVNSVDTMSVLYDPDLIFNPFDLNDPDLSSLLCDIDPDFNFYNNFNTKVYTHCKYHNESSLNGEIRKSNSNPSRVFSLCHFNIRSMKQNINEFECYYVQGEMG